MASAKSRQILFFLKGRDMLDKEMDIGYIVKYVRILRYFLKTVLDKDQRVLLKLKSTEFIPSSEDETKAKADVKKIKHKDLILERYVEEIQKKTLGKMDFRLLEVLGFKETIRILTEEKRKQLAHEEEMNRRAHVDGGTFAGRSEHHEQLLHDDISMFGGGDYKRSPTKTQRNPKAESFSSHWQ